MVKGAVIFLVLFLATSAFGKPRTVFYEGSLLDEQGKPVSGIFRLEFSFYRVPNGGKKLWSEVNFVAVDEGKYVIELGRYNPIPKSLDLDRLYIGISLPGGEEFYRGKFSQVKIVTPQEFAKMKKKYEAGIEIGLNKKENQENLLTKSYAEKAGIAFEAEHAKNADKLENFSLKEIEQLLVKKLKFKVGDDQVFTEPVGGKGGAEYFVLCPKGHVVVGIRGGAGKYVDRIQLICAPIK